MASFQRKIISCIFVFFLLSLAIAGEARVLFENNANEGFVRVNGAHFELNRSTFLFNGFNSYWLMHVAAEPSERYKVTEVFREASSAGLSVCRTWAFCDGGDRALQISPGVYDERVFQEYAQWARNAGALINGEDDFYTNYMIKDYYKNHVKKVVTRFNTITGMTYKDDSTIMAWELMNEPRNQADYSGNTVNEWVQEMASYVKSLDNKHLLEIGMEGFYGDSMSERKPVNPGYQVGTDFISSHLIKEIDFATIHAYTDQWLSGQSDDAQMTFMQKWMTSHWQDAKSILKKPLVLTEFGKSSRDPGFSQNIRDAFMSTIYRSIYSFAKDGGVMGGSLIWQLVAQGMDNYDDGYCILLGQNPSTAGIITGQSHAMTSLAHLVQA
ncbi:Mannan endo-1,4-beta-mannosidase 2 [Datura stramonium]|uniref:mannan endo-1,4-beta-mannosidase n=1 Tax=Datura stramonium TaxID=4076 RepID=A0ABS8UWP5_DATST|nr:Mannan endo-1,4-beta-mannosidase 2 [Datura stramonium]